MLFDYLPQDLIQTNRYGSSSGVFAFKRVTHKEGWMVNLIVNETTQLEWTDVSPPVNFSYEGTIYSLKVSNTFNMNESRSRSGMGARAAAVLRRGHPSPLLLRS